MTILAIVEIGLGFLVLISALAVIGVIAIIYAIYQLLKEDKDRTVKVTIDWADLPPGDTKIGPDGVDFKVKISADIGGINATANLKDIEVQFKALKTGSAALSPSNGKVKTGTDGVASCKFSGAADDSTKVEAKVTIDGKTTTLTAPDGKAEYETSTTN